MPLVHPFDSLSLPLSIRQLRVIAEQYSASVLSRLGISEAAAAYKLNATPQQQVLPKRRIRLGYVSGAAQCT